jgi:hypothetical protein
MARSGLANRVNRSYQSGAPLYDDDFDDDFAVVDTADDFDDLEYEPTTDHAYDDDPYDEHVEDHVEEPVGDPYDDIPVAVPIDRRTVCHAVDKLREEADPNRNLFDVHLATKMLEFL